MSSFLDVSDDGSVFSGWGHGPASVGLQRRPGPLAPATGPLVVGLPFGPALPRRFVDDPHLVMLYSPASPIAERYRRLRFSLEQVSPDLPVPVQVAVVTSAVPAEGKTTTALNLALAYAEDRDHRVLLVGADLRRPSLARYVDPEPALGLSDVLAGETSPEDALIEMAGKRLWILPPGTPSRTPLDLLQTEGLGRLIAWLRRRFDRIVIDTPPTVPFTDAAVIAAHADGTLLVVRAGSTTKPLVQRATESLFAANILGVVLNDIEFTVLDRYNSTTQDPSD